MTQRELESFLNCFLLHASFWKVPVRSRMYTVARTEGEPADAPAELLPCVIEELDVRQLGFMAPPLKNGCEGSKDAECRKGRLHCSDEAIVQGRAKM